MSKFKSCIKCGEEKVDHEPEHIKYNQYDTCVDKEVVPLLKILWEKEIDTNFSCIGEYCLCDDATCRVGMTQLVFWSDDNLNKFLKPFFSSSFTSDYHLFSNIHDYKKNFTIIRSLDEIHDSNRKSTVWRWEPMTPANSTNTDNQDSIEGVSIPSQYRDRIRWDLRFPKEDLPAIIRVLTNEISTEREINHYLLKEGKIEIIGSITLRDKEIKSSGIYSEIQNFDEDKASSDYKKEEEFWNKNNISYDDYLEASKIGHAEELAKYKTSNLDLAILLKNIKDSYVTITTK
jgi:hypothetical protein